MKKSIEVLNKMLDVYKTSMKHKKMQEPIDSRHKVIFVFFSAWALLCLLTVYLMFNVRYVANLGIPGPAVIFAILVGGFICFLCTAIFCIDRPGSKLKIILNTSKKLWKKSFFILTKKIQYFFLKKKIMYISKEINSVYPEISEFFYRKSSMDVLSSLVEEMRLPVEYTRDYTTKLETLVYQYKNTVLFPSMNDLNGQAKKNSEQETNVQFFEKTS